MHCNEPAVGGQSASRDPSNIGAVCPSSSVAWTATWAIYPIILPSATSFPERRLPECRVMPKYWTPADATVDSKAFIKVSRHEAPQHCKNMYGVIISIINKGT